MIDTAKKIKVRISRKIGAIYTEDGVKHLPGEIIEIPEKSFRPDHYEKIEPPTKKPEPVKENKEDEAAKPLPEVVHPLTSAEETEEKTKGQKEPRKSGKA